MGLNDLKVEVYASGTTRIDDAGNELINAEGIRFSTIYPGGIFGDCSFTIPRDVARWWEMNGAKRVVVRNGMVIVWEGEIDNLISAVQSSSSQVEIKAIGKWGTLMQRRRWQKPWCDDRMDQHIWYEPYTAWSVNDQNSAAADDHRPPGAAALHAESGGVYYKLVSPAAILCSHW